MTKQQAICLKLAHWLGDGFPEPRNGTVYLDEDDESEFNPFSDTTEGRAQFAECVIKAELGLLPTGFNPHRPLAVGYKHPASYFARNIELAEESPQALVAAHLETIFYAIGGEWSE